MEANGTSEQLGYVDIYARLSIVGARFPRPLPEGLSRL